MDPQSQASIQPLMSLWGGDPSQNTGQSGRAEAPLSPPSPPAPSQAAPGLEGAGTLL